MMAAPLTPANLLTNMRDRVDELNDAADMTHERVLDATTKAHSEWLRLRAVEDRTRAIADELSQWCMIWTATLGIE